MPQPPILNVIEIFPSIQGEGLRQGAATLFVRLAGCNLHCSFCDTKYAWKKGKTYPQDRVVKELREIRHSFPAHWVCLTGGEPLLQDIAALVRALKRDSFKIQVETNGTLYQHLPVDWYTVSPKPDEYASRPEYREKAREVKLIVTRELAFSEVKSVRKKFPAKTPLLLQPQSNRKWSMEKALRMVKQAAKEGLENVVFSLQLHRILGIR